MSEQTFSLADLAGVDMDQVEEKRMENTPEGLMHFRVKEAKLDKLGANEKPAVVIELEIVDVMALIDPNIKADDWIGKSHNEAFMFNVEEPLVGLGWLKAFIVDTGFECSGSLAEVIANYAGHEFTAPIKHRADKNDKDRIYCNINRNKITPPPSA